jgi:hypothetical protein
MTNLSMTPLSEHKSLKEMLLAMMTCSSEMDKTETIFYWRDWLKSNYAFPAHEVDRYASLLKTFFATKSMQERQ